jgi:hypothetical protein
MVDFVSVAAEPPLLNLLQVTDHRCTALQVQPGALVHERRVNVPKPEAGAEDELTLHDQECHNKVWHHGRLSFKLGP